MTPSLQKTLALFLECSMSNGTGLPRILLTVGGKGWCWRECCQQSSSVTPDGLGVHGHSSVSSLDEMKQEKLVKVMWMCLRVYLKKEVPEVHVISRENVLFWKDVDALDVCGRARMLNVQKKFGGMLVRRTQWPFKDSSYSVRLLDLPVTSWGFWSRFFPPLWIKVYLDFLVRVKVLFV